MGATTKTPYETDFAAWADETAAAIRAGELRDLDWENIAEEIEGLGRSDRRTAQSQLQRLMMHLLKLRIQPERESRSWHGSIVNAQIKIVNRLEDSPSVRLHLEEKLERTYAQALAQAIAETGKPANDAPAKCPWTLDELLESDINSLR